MPRRDEPIRGPARSAAASDARATAPRIGAGGLAAAWVLTVAVDLFFNAGVLSPLFDQAREPSLLPDAELFRRIPVAYAALGVAVVALAWLVRRVDARTALRGGALGAATGGVAACLGIVSLWTAVDLTAAFVVLQAGVQVTALAAAGAVLGALRGTPHRRRLFFRVYGVALAAVVTAVVAQNLLGTWST